MPTLNVGFGASPTIVKLTANGDGFREALEDLGSEFGTSRNTSPGAIEISLADFVADLRALTGWPEKDAVHWDETLADLVRSVLDDAARVKSQLESETKGLAEWNLGPDWVADLTNFQKRDISELLQLSHGANFSVPGAGKTRVTLACYTALREQAAVNRMLVVAPKSAFQSWEEEVEKTLSRPVKIHRFLGQQVPTCEILLANYDRVYSSLSTIAGWVKAGRTLVVLDEAHRMKKGDAGAHGSACMALAPLAARRMVLSGTPAPNGAKDLENLFGFVWPGYGQRQVKNAVGGGNLQQASRRLSSLYVRTTKSELGITPPVVKVRTVQLTPAHSRAYRALLGDVAHSMPSGDMDLTAMGKVSAYLLMAATSPALLLPGESKYEALDYSGLAIPEIEPYRISEESTFESLLRELPSIEMSPKYLEVLRIVSNNAKLGKKTIVWSTYVRSILTLERLLDKYEPAVVYGGSEYREESIERFRSSDDCMVLITNPATLGEGISLHHECNNAVYLDRDFAAGRFLQSIDRINRLGMSPGVETRIDILEAAGTVDEIVTQRLNVKLNFLGSVLDDSDVVEMADLDEVEVISGLDSLDAELVRDHVRRTAT